MSRWGSDVKPLDDYIDFKSFLSHVISSKGCIPSGEKLFFEEFEKNVINNVFPKDNSLPSGIISESYELWYLDLENGNQLSSYIDLQYTKNQSSTFLNDQNSIMTQPENKKSCSSELRVENIQFEKILFKLHISGTRENPLSFQVLEIKKVPCSLPLKDFIKLCQEKIEYIDIDCIKKHEQKQKSIEKEFLKLRHHIQQCTDSKCIKEHEQKLHSIGQESLPTPLAHQDQRQSKELDVSGERARHILQDCTSRSEIHDKLYDFLRTEIDLLFFYSEGNYQKIEKTTWDDERNFLSLLVTFHINKTLGDKEVIAPVFIKRTCAAKFLETLCGASNSDKSSNSCIKNPKLRREKIEKFLPDLIKYAQNDEKFKPTRENFAKKIMDFASKEGWWEKNKIVLGTLEADLRDMKWKEKIRPRFD